MAKLTTTDLTSLTSNEANAVSAINTNFAAVETAMELTLTRTGTSPNEMESDLDMNSNDILNCGTGYFDNIIVDGDEVASQDLFKTIAVSGQSDIVADSPTDTLTFAAGANVTITTDASTDTVTISSSISGASLADGDYGDIVVSGSGAVIAIDAGVIVDADINASAAIAATKIADGSVSNAEFQYISTLSSNAQTQIDGKQPLDSDLTTIAGLTATTDNFLQSKSSAWASRTPTQVTADLISMVGDSGSGGTKGLVPAPAAGDAAAVKFLKADGTWETPSGTGAPADVDYLVKTANGTLSAERVVTDSSTVVADWSTAGVVKLNVVGGGSPTIPADFKDSVALATTGPITLSGEQSVDGTMTAASRVLVKDQVVPAENGPYLSGAGAWTRTADADTSAEVTPGMLVLVEGGTVNGDQVFILTTNGTITLGTTALVFQAIAVPTNIFVGKTVAGTTYTHVLTDSGKRLNATNAGTKTFTIAPQTGGGGVNSAVNTEIEICNIGAGLLTIAPGSGVTLNSLSGILTVPQYHCVKVKKRANPNTWEVTGIYDTDTLKSDVAANLTAGFTATAYNLGTQTTGTTTPDPDNGNFQRAVNGGAHTLAPPNPTPGDSLTMIIQYTNNGSAGAITTSGFTLVDGDPLTTTSGHDFMFFITVCNAFTLLTVKALQ